jgi:hypothetical protein
MFGTIFGLVILVFYGLIPVFGSCYYWSWYQKHELSMYVFMYIIPLGRDKQFLFGTASVLGGQVFIVLSLTGPVTTLFLLPVLLSSTLLIVSVPYIHSRASFLTDRKKKKHKDKPKN